LPPFLGDFRLRKQDVQQDPRAPRPPVGVLASLQGLQPLRVVELEKLQLSLDMKRNGERGRRSEGRGGPHMIPRGPPREVPSPVALGVMAMWFEGRQCFVTRHVVGDGQENRADEVQRAAPTRRYGAKRSSHAKSADTAKTLL
jgi:hypothetical protein